ncbi:DUF5707 domain-containing protein [Streptomyces griseiscabiei]|uniref:DUF5707 domain-containing protein n=1 Tax=Streptomyces griseiscabiei TaxID=2993540 RepID=A0ABU4L702_9ACTN|nr:DUF5707 domain-containing protein [Streptomyces griseiscabiei]MBZ3906285.1 hypothetical protein [Streptomyces griseiscabiei]MDX2911281.1 DUF5707 domain-containing protein [Streptomyces griseiscabiei]
MSRRTVLCVAVGVVVLGGAGALTLAHAGDQSSTPAHSTARYIAPDGDRDGSLTFSTDVTESSGVKSVKVLAWPQDSSFAEDRPTAKDMAGVDSAACEPAGKDTAHCTYRVEVTAADAKSSPRGAWHVAVLVTAKDGSTTLDAEAADFTVR